MLNWLRRALGGEGKSAPHGIIAWHALSRPTWSARDYGVFAREGYGRNAVAYRCVRLIAEASASVSLKVSPVDHPLAQLLAAPNPEQTGPELFEAFYGHLQVAGNAFLEAVSLAEEPPRELFVLRPDRMAVIPGSRGWPLGWEMRVGAAVTRFERDPFTDASPILHLKLFAPADDWPFPYFPARTDLWTDGSSWRLGHWLNGRAGAAPLADVVREIAARGGDIDIDVERLGGIVPGYVADAPSSPHSLIAPLMAAFGFDVHEHEGQLQFAGPSSAAPLALELDDVGMGENGRVRIIRADAADAPSEARVRFIDPTRDYRLATVSAHHRDAAGPGVATFDAPICLDPVIAEDAAQRLLAEALADIEIVHVLLPPSLLALEPGDRVTLNEPGAAGVFRVLSIENTEATLTREPPQRAAMTFAPTPAPPELSMSPSAPDLVMLDLPPLPGAEDDARPLAAAFAAPWPDSIDIYAGEDADTLSLRGVAARPATMGRLTAHFYPGPVDRWDDGNVLCADLVGAPVASVSEIAVLNGANAFAIEGANGEWEIIQARRADLVGAGQYQFSSLLRGQQGTDGAMGADTGARIVLLTPSLTRLAMNAGERGADLIFAAVAGGYAPGDDFATQADATWRPIWARPFAPVHIKAKRALSGEIALSWIRRTRQSGDPWEYGEPPLGEELETYLVEVVSGGTVIRSWTTTAPATTYAMADQIVDFGAPAASFDVRIAQISARFGAGARRESLIAV